jgi:hypothetical protein
VPAVGEAGDVTNIAEQPGRVGRADALEFLQPAAGGGDQFGQLRVGRFDLLIDDREYGVDLSGLKVVFVGDWPGDFNLGNGTARLYIDRTATVEQRRELEAICSGQKGGAWEVLAGSIIQWMPAQAAEIEVQWGDSPTVHVGSIGRIGLQPLKDAAGQRAQIVGATVMTALQLERLDVARSEGTQFADPEMRQWSSGGSGDVSRFNWRT